MEDNFDTWEFQEGPAEYGYDRITGNLIVDKSFEFALRVVRFSKGLRDPGWYDASRQLFKCGTSIGANVHEAQDAESRDDFIHKMKISAKEASETRFWLKLCKYADELPYEEGMLEDLQSIRNILASIIIKARRNKVQ
jgi:four helix bundle protein